MILFTDARHSMQVEKSVLERLTADGYALKTSYTPPAGKSLYRISVVVTEMEEAPNGSREWVEKR